VAETICSALDVPGATIRTRVDGDDLRITIQGPTGPEIPMLFGLVSRFIADALWASPAPPATIVDTTADHLCSLGAVY